MTTVTQTTEFSRWVKGLKDREAVARIFIRIRRLAMGNPGQMRNLSGGVSELKIDYGAGYRVYFCRRGADVVLLLCGGDKRTQTADIARALTLAKEVK